MASFAALNQHSVSIVLCLLHYRMCRVLQCYMPASTVIHLQVVYKHQVGLNNDKMWLDPWPISIVWELQPGFIMPCLQLGHAIRHRVVIRPGRLAIYAVF